MMKRFTTAATLLSLLLAALPLSGGGDVSLRGSRASMERQNRIARELDFSFLRTTREVNRFASAGRLVPVWGNEDFQVIADWPYARPVVRDFVTLLGADYRAGCGEPLVVTSLTRPLRAQPSNASPLSVHPAGMAVDLRVSARASCVRWLERELMSLEEAGLVDATREYHPPHFHVAVFPEPFEAHLAARAVDSVVTVAAARADSIQAAEHARVFAALAPVPTIAAAEPAPALRWPAVLAAVARLLLRV